MKSTGSHQKSHAPHGPKPHATGISNRPRTNEEPRQHDLPMREEAKKDTPSRQRSGSSHKS